MAIQNTPNKKTNHKLIYDNKTFKQNKRLKYLIANFLYRIASKANPKTQEALAVVLYRIMSKKNFDRQLLQEMDVCINDNLSNDINSNDINSYDNLSNDINSNDINSYDNLSNDINSYDINSDDINNKRLYDCCLRSAIRAILNSNLKKKYQADFFYNTALDRSMPDRIYCHIPVFTKQNFHFYNLNNLKTGSLLYRIKQYERRNSSSLTNQGSC